MQRVASSQIQPSSSSLCYISEGTSRNLVSLAPLWASHNNVTVTTVEWKSPTTMTAYHPYLKVNIEWEKTDGKGQLGRSDGSNGISTVKVSL